MATIEREISVDTPAREIWSTLIADPNHWDEWLTPLRGLSETVEGPVAPGLSFGARIGNLSGKIEVVEVIEGQRLRWKAGPGPLVAMGMGMKGTLELDSHEGHTLVHLTMKSPPMMRPMMQAMTGLDTSDEMTKTINRIKELGEKRG